MSDLTRRGFVKTSAGAAAGMTAIGALVSGQAEAHTHAHGHAHGHAQQGSHPVVAFVKDPRKGEISIMSGQREVKVRNRKLAAQIARAAR